MNMLYQQTVLFTRRPKLLTPSRLTGYMPETRVGASYNKYKNILQLVRTEIYVSSVERVITFFERYRKRNSVRHGIVNHVLCSRLTGLALEVSRYRTYYKTTVYQRLSNSSYTVPHYNLIYQAQIFSTCNGNISRQ